MRRISVLLFDSHLVLGPVGAITDNLWACSSDDALPRDMSLFM